ncbi:hypothetical protein MRX96_033162 [Rhipicephalus microplus]
MARGPKKHLKRLNAPKSWMLDKLGGVFAPRPSTGPHKLRESLPLIIMLRNRLKYALTGAEVKKIVKQRLIKVDGKVRTDTNYPAGFMDVVTIEKTGESSSGCCGPQGSALPHHTRRAHHSATPTPLIKVNDTVKVDLATGKIDDYIKFDSGNMCMVTGGHNLGRVGIITSRERHPGSFDIVHVKDSQGHSFATRLNYIFVIGKSTKPYISLPRGKGIKLTVAEERDRRLQLKAQHLSQ